MLLIVAFSRRLNMISGGEPLSFLREAFYGEEVGLMATTRSASSILSFLAGLGAGVLLGIFFAPQPGRDLRREVREQVREWADRGREVLERQREQFNSASRGERATSEAGTHGGGEPPPDTV